MAVRERYVNFYTDFAFKKLFGTEANKDLLMSFLNALLDGQEEIRDLTYLNVEHPGHVATDRKAVFDVYCENSRGEKFLIEMQKAEQEFFKDRSIYYSTFPIQEQAPQGKWNFELHKVYVLGILNFTFDDTGVDCLHHEVQLVEKRTRQVFFDKLTYIYLEMPKFTKTERELETDFDKWLYAMKHLSTLLERPQALQEAVFRRFFEQAEIAGFTEEEQRTYRESLKDYWDLFSVTETAEKKGRRAGLAAGMKKGRKAGLKEGEAIGLEKGEAIGLEKGEAIGRKAGLEEGQEIGRKEGRKEGREEGLKEGKMAIALQLKQMGLSDAQILQATGLSAAELEAVIAASGS